MVLFLAKEFLLNFRRAEHAARCKKSMLKLLDMELNWRRPAWYITPSKDTMKVTMKTSLEDAGLLVPDQISYINGHEQPRNRRYC